MGLYLQWIWITIIIRKNYRFVKSPKNPKVFVVKTKQTKKSQKQANKKKPFCPERGKYILGGGNAYLSFCLLALEFASSNLIKSSAWMHH